MKYAVEKLGADGQWRVVSEWFAAKWMALNVRAFVYATSSDTRVVERA